MATKYHVGDRVRIRSDLVPHKLYYMEGSSSNNSVVDKMLEFAGKEVTIILADEQYLIKEIPFYLWTDGMIECLVKPAEPEMTDIDESALLGMLE